MSDAVTTAAAHLFAPRMRFERGAADSAAARQASGQNPPAGAIITYSLNAAQNVTIEILDARAAPW